MLFRSLGRLVAKAKRIHCMNTSISKGKGFVAIIPARGGSKGIPRKNLVDLGGKPLIAHSIEVARACGRFARVVVSTEDREIAQVARHFGAEVPVLRPRRMATDSSLPGEALNHMLTYLSRREGCSFDGYVALYPTHPFRRVAMLHTLMDHLEGGCRRVVTVRAMRPRSNGFFVMEEGGTVRPLQFSPLALITDRKSVV